MEWLKIPTSTELVRVRTDEIVAVEAQGNYSVLHFYDTRKYTVTFKIHYLDEAFERLRNNPFIRIGRSLIINKQFVYRINLVERKCYLAGQPMTKECFFKAPRVALEALKKFMETDKAEDKPDWKNFESAEETEQEGGQDGQR